MQSGRDPLWRYVSNISAGPPEAQQLLMLPVVSVTSLWKGCVFTSWCARGFYVCTCLKSSAFLVLFSCLCFLTTCHRVSLPHPSFCFRPSTPSGLLRRVSDSHVLLLPSLVYLISVVNSHHVSDGKQRSTSGLLIACLFNYPVLMTWERRNRGWDRRNHSALWPDTQPHLPPVTDSFWPLPLTVTCELGLPS